MEKLTCFFGNLVQSRALESIDGGFVDPRMRQENIFFSRRNCTSLQSKDFLSFVHMPRLGVHGKKTNTQFNLEMYCSLAMLSNVDIIGYRNLGAPAVPHRIA